MARYDNTLVLPQADLRGSNCCTCSGRFLAQSRHYAAEVRVR
jgi:hypothetical protein